MTTPGSAIRTTQSRSRSRSLRSRSSRPASLTRVQSGRHFDDHYAYHDDADDAAARSVRDRISRIPSVEDDRSESEKDHPLEEVETPVEIDLIHPEDIESRPRLEKRVSARSAKTKDPNLVTWDGPDDPENPKNWPTRRKWLATFVVSMFAFFSPVSSSMVAPALSTIAKDLDITSQFETALVLSIFVLAYAIGPLFLGPLSEVYGRVPVLQISNLFFLAWTLGCGFAKTKGQLIAFRFLAGLGGSAPLGIGGAVLGDCWTADQRGKAIGVYTLMPLIGPAVGPIAGGFITEKSTWRWAFWAVCIADSVIQVVGIFFLQETYTPTVLQKRVKRLRKETGNTALYTEYDGEKKIDKVLSVALVRPFRMLATQPIIQVIALYQGYLYGNMYLMLTTFPHIFTQIYHEDIGIGGINYISLGLGFWGGSQATAVLNDAIYRRMKAQNGGVGKPEFRIPLMFGGSALVPVGLFWYGWSAQARIHWIMPNIGAFIFAAGSIVLYQCMQTYIVDCYGRFAASGIGATVLLRSSAGFGFPLFAGAMFATLGYGWGNSLLGFLSIVIGIPAPFLFWRYGEQLRMKSEYAMDV